MLPQQEILLWDNSTQNIVDLTISNNPTILAMNNYNGTASPFNCPFWINKLVASSGYTIVGQVGSSSAINAGEGFTMKELQEPIQLL
jgi:hypothetical protein